MKNIIVVALVTAWMQPATSADDWQTLSVALADQGAEAKSACQMKVPAGWKIQDKTATSGDEAAATLVLEAEKPEAWWTKRKRLEFKNSRMFQDTRTNYWIEVVGALMSGSEDGTTHIVGLRDGNLVCHAVLEFKSSDWEKKYGETAREMVGSIKPAQ
jgi:hypothetical protein